MSKTKSTKTPNQTVEDFLTAFSRQTPDIKNAIAQVIPAYNALSSLHAKTFEEFSLVSIAKKKGIDYTDPLFSFDSVIPPCPECKEENRIKHLKENLYQCRNCKKKFSLNPNSISSGTQCSSLTWMKLLHCMLEYYTVERTCQYCNISAPTLYELRDKIFYAMRIMMDEVKLYGVIQCDNTFIRTNYKGYALCEKEYPEGSLFDVVNFIPRPPRKRGGSYSYSTKNQNSICIFTAIDEYGHTVVRYVGIGNATATKLHDAVPPSRYLLRVPEEDPFAFTSQKEIVNKPRKTSLLVSDKENAIAKYAHLLGISHESHVFRQQGKQRALPKGAHNIQRVNALHRRLKDFFRKSNYVSSKYLPGFLTFFEFIENTGASDEAIGRLFEILVQPGLGESKEYYQDMFMTPNYIFEWAKDNTLLNNLSYNQMLAAYLYQTKLDHEKEGVHDITMEYIMEETGYETSSSVRRIYKNIASGGGIELVCEKMQSQRKKKMVKDEPEIEKEPKEAKAEDDQQKRKVRPKPSFETMLALYDEYCNHLNLPLEQQGTLSDFLKQFNKSYSVKIYTYEANDIFERIEATGNRTIKVSELRRNISKMKRKRRFCRGSMSETCQKKYQDCLRRFEEIQNSYRMSNTPLPYREEIMKMIGEEQGLSAGTVSKYIQFAKVQNKEKNNNENSTGEV